MSHPCLSVGNIRLCHLCLSVLPVLPDFVGEVQTVLVAHQPKLICSRMILYYAGERLGGQRTWGSDVSWDSIEKQARRDLSGNLLITIRPSGDQWEVLFNADRFLFGGFQEAYQWASEEILSAGRSAKVVLA